MKRFHKIILILLLFQMSGASADAAVLSKLLAKVRLTMQKAFQLSFLPQVPVVFYKQSFHEMFRHVNSSIDKISLVQNSDSIPGPDLQDDKSTHIKKSAELALHIKSLIGSAHLAYGLTMIIGLIKEAIDGSFLNPDGYREKADIFADHVGAMAVFGSVRFDKALEKKLPFFVKPSQQKQSATVVSPAFTELSKGQEAPKEPQESKEIVNLTNKRRKLLAEYYQAVQQQDVEAAKAVQQKLLISQ